MAALIRSGCFVVGNRFIKQHMKQIGIAKITTTGIYRYWNKDWKPGPYPKTEEERRAAAEKYYLLPEDYEPCDDDGSGKGDYPKLPAISAENRDPFEDYDFPVLKRNFCEPLHCEFDMLTETRHNANPDLQKPLWWYAMCCFGSIGAGIAFFFISKPFELARPALPKQYPSKGVKHYTFEPSDS